MKSLATRFIKDESGATAIEYALIACGLAVVIVAIFASGGPVDDMLTGLFERVGSIVDNAPST
ncbi:Flp family type IVb pilin [Microvirga zambiensis]|uniref:Flp family type IVb pilin n=1 Tax=Microvirga zambiensis TaxID=1402137 RepID=UPI00191E94D9|nr:Flp family type IVb pilin [Microvirga zambiensis]